MRILRHYLLCVAYLSSNLALDLPSKPVDLQCIILQNGKKVSSKMTCQWDLEEKAPQSLTSYTLYAQYREEPLSIGSDEALANKLTIDLKSFPFYMTIKVWVEAKNELGSVNSTQLVTDVESFLKTNPPNVTLKADCPTTLNVTWAPPIHKTLFLFMYNIRYCQAGSSVWTEVLQNITEAYVESYRLQVLQPYTDYVVQMRCINRRNIGYWSDWSPNATARTPEARPESKPDLWRVYEESNNTVKLIWKDPVKSHGKILAYNITVEENGVNPVSFTANSTEYQLHLNGGTTWIRMTANNSVGISPMATLKIPQPGQELQAGAEQMSWSVRDGQLWVDWLPPSGSNVSEYVLEWVSVLHGQIDWQRVPAQRNATSYSVPLKGHFEPFKRYNISVCPIYREKNESFYNLPGKKITVGAYLKQGPPLEGPSVEATATQNSVHLKWEEIPVAKQQGFLTNYTIFYKTGDREQFVVVGPDVHSYNLTGLASASRYVVHIMASNVEGSVNGSDSILYIMKYDDSKIKMIVVLVCLGFLFIFLIMILSVTKREVIKNHFWPQVSSPSLSSIANWSPDRFNRVDTPKKVALHEVSVVEVGMFNGKRGTRHCEEDKTVLLLKKDKEHSSGIGGSSCMSSPRQSVSDSDEGDSCQTTASTVQYSSVVDTGNKRQNRSLQTPVFARSESTQPLLDCDEDPEGSCHQRSTSFRRGRGLEQLQEGRSSYISLNFCPMAEKNDTPNHTENLFTQLSGYRPQ